MRYSCPEDAASACAAFLVKFEVDKASILSMCLRCMPRSSSSQTGKQKSRRKIWLNFFVYQNFFMFIFFITRLKIFLGLSPMVKAHLGVQVGS